MYKYFFVILFVVPTLSVQKLSAEAELPDPTRPLEYSGAVQAQKALHLDSILIGSKRKIAVINGEQFAESQWVGDKKIVAISRRSVTLRQGDQKIVLSLHGKSIRQ